MPGLAGSNHAARAVQAARSLIATRGYAEGAAWVPIGAGVHTGLAFIGSVGSDSHVDLTALGDTVNVAARLASAAGPGEILVTLDAADAAELDRFWPGASRVHTQGPEHPHFGAGHFAGRGEPYASMTASGPDWFVSLTRERERRD